MHPMNKIICHRDLVVWQKSIALACRVYASTRDMPTEERSGVIGQLRRAAFSIPCNIAQGSARRNHAEFIQFLHLARGSQAELESGYLIATRLKLVSDGAATLEQIAEVGRLLNGLIRSVASSSREAHARACAHPPSTADR